MVSTYIAYLDEFGHDGPYVGRSDPRHRTSPVFGLAGYVLPVEHVRWFGTWFFKRKCELLEHEIAASGKPPAVWEKKGSTVYTVGNVTRHREIRRFTHRMLRQISRQRGFVFYVGMKKTATPQEHNSKGMYIRVFEEAIKRLDQFCTQDVGDSAHFLLALDSHGLRQHLITSAARSMYGGNNPLRCLIEPPMHFESHRYQTIQAADWIAALLGRLGALWAEPSAYPEYEVFQKYFAQRLFSVRYRSSIRL